MHPRKLRRAPTAFPGEKLITLAAPSNDKRLNDARGTNRLRKLFKRGLREARARLIRTGLDKIDIHLENSASGFDGTGWRGSGARRRYRNGGRRLWSSGRELRLPNERAEPFPQGVSGHWR